eukprot:TRINITY_DN25640_c0_g1_i3.p1 TRINITY_DN25640_c0_g1~~TRINITY_DN25640_c0_g1_i3.p1  ORF type:complete len:693 (-),score=145.52 TRINITY_DN25640_c0_g1_i3:59-2137(-)
MMLCRVDVVAWVCLAQAAVAVDGPTVSTWISQYGQDRFIYERFFATAAPDEWTGAGGASVNIPGRNPAAKMHYPGVFVELGAADGMSHSNTLAFERKFGWSGVLIEPSNEMFAQLKQNRPGCKCVHACVSRIAGDYEFMDDGLNSGFLGPRGVEGLMRSKQAFEGIDPAVVKGFAEVRQGDDTNWRRCQPLGDILKEQLGSVRHIDYMSLDVEGGELDILRSLDFSYWYIDVFSIEMSTIESRVKKADAISALLADRGYVYVDRLGPDEIYVKRRGVVDPGCHFPALSLEKPPNRKAGVNGWSSMRDRLQEVWQRLDGVAEQGQELPFAEISKLHSWAADLLDLVGSWERVGNPSTWEAQCPVGTLTLALTTLLLYNRRTQQPFDYDPISLELRQHTLFHPSSRVDGLVNNAADVDRREAVRDHERSGKGAFEHRLPLGRPWHEVSFADVLQGGWPLFGMLDVAARFTGKPGRLFDQVEIHGEVQIVPLTLPEINCRLLLEPGFPDAVHLHVHHSAYRGQHTSSQDVLYDSDVCGMLGMASSRAYAVRAAVRAAAAGSSAMAAREEYKALANFSAACAGERTFGAEARQACSRLTMEDCAAVDHRARLIPRRCLQGARAAAGQSLQIRRRQVLNLQARRLLLEVERLFRAFVERYGIFNALWAVGQIAQHQVNGKKVETLFAVLHSVQSMID